MLLGYERHTRFCYLEVHFMSSPLLEVKDLQVTVGEEQKVLLDGLNLTINPGL